MLSTHLFVSQQEADKHCILLNPEHLSDVQRAAGEEVVDDEGEEDADGEEHVEAGELDQVRHRDVARRRLWQEQSGCHLPLKFRPKNIERVQNCPDVAILNSLFGLYFFVFLSF